MENKAVHEDLLRFSGELDCRPGAHHGARSSYRRRPPQPTPLPTLPTPARSCASYSEVAVATLLPTPSTPPFPHETASNAPHLRDLSPAIPNSS
ncbi:hypothetical protein TIFTF001_005463 [Ficus carica]|uniref:Uncharacterized protein n=1 Tax=Ficus carica TaxID=3494 RepID=A0AA87ZEZ6_FICCA|nr:hypothetical protein TIFTF001_005463 [Ficus carica]